MNYNNKYIINSTSGSGSISPKTFKEIIKNIKAETLYQKAGSMFALTMDKVSIYSNEEVQNDLVIETCISYVLEHQNRLWTAEVEFVVYENSESDDVPLEVLCDNEDVLNQIDAFIKTSFDVVNEQDDIWKNIKKTDDDFENSDFSINSSKITINKLSPDEIYNHIPTVEKRIDMVSKEVTLLTYKEILSSAGVLDDLEFGELLNNFREFLWTKDGMKVLAEVRSNVESKIDRNFGQDFQSSNQSSLSLT